MCTLFVDAKLVCLYVLPLFRRGTNVPDGRTDGKWCHVMQWQSFKEKMFENESHRMFRMMKKNDSPKLVCFQCRTDVCRPSRIVRELFLTIFATERPQTALTCGGGEDGI
jgi:hypothetical protein